jgi:hypothetical protein
MAAKTKGRTGSLQATPSTPIVHHSPASNAAAGIDESENG